MSPVLAATAAVLAANGIREDASADAMRSLGDAHRAAVLLHEANEWEGPATRSPVLAALAAQVQGLVDAGLASGSGASALTTAELKVLQYLPTHLSFPEIGAHLYLSRHIIKSQAVSAYRTLGVSSRSEAVERAREFGPLPAR